MLFRQRAALPRIAAIAACLSSALSYGAETTSGAEGGGLSYNHDIQPILSNHCFACHGPDEKTRMAGLRLDVEADAFKALASGAHALVPGDHAASAVYQRISTSDTSEVMPPPKFNKPLKPAQIEAIRQWIDQGAPYEAHWSFTPVKWPHLMPVQNKEWGRNEIDNFILARLEREGLAPSPEADKEALIRRVALDLTGLPPSLDAVDAFLADTSPDAYEKLVDRLMASPQYAEHQTRFWLDAARYADTNGFHIDNERYMWPWRDWVIKAFRENMPFDQFTVEQLAGDLLPNATLEQRIASGFNRNHMVNFEGGAIPEEYQTAYVMDRVDTTSTVWLGLTMKCAQCHDHKYDPISQKEFYQFYAFFNTIAEQGLDGRNGNAAPIIKAPSPEQEVLLAESDKEIAAVNAALLAPKPDIDAAQAAWESEWQEKIAQRWTPMTPAAATSINGAQLAIGDDGVVTVSGDNPATDVYEVTAVVEGSGITGLRLDALPDPAREDGGTGRSPNANFALSEIEILSGPADKEDLTPVKIFTAAADFSQDTFPIENAFDGNPGTAWAVEGQTYKAPRTAFFTFEEPVGNAMGTRFVVRLRFETKFEQHAMAKFKLATVIDPSMAPAYMGPWYMNGPFLTDAKEKAYENDFGPETSINLRETYADGRLKWVKSSPGFENGVIYELDGDIAATYLYREIRALQAHELTFGVGTNDAVKVWLNGDLVHANDAARAVQKNEDRVTVHLKEGVNTLMLKAVNYGNSYAFVFDRLDEAVGEIPLDVELMLADSADGRTDSENNELRAYYRRLHDPEYPQLETRLAELKEKRNQLEVDIPTTMVMAEMAEQPRQTFILDRGEYDRPTDPVDPGTPKVLPAISTAGNASRLDLAKWLVSPANPLPARVTVNRYWERYFGTGLVASSEDFGVQGAWPSHPRLLDWLAAEFIASGWDVNHMHRLIVTSSTYRQASTAQEDMLVRDPENILLARGPRVRLDAEVIRDNALAVSGLLVERVGGPSVKPYQPPGIWEEVAYGAGKANFSANRYEPDTGDKLYRRSMYTFWKRTAPPPAMMLFDTPNRETCQVSRARTNTPLQALLLLNGTQFVEASRALAIRMLTEGGADPAARIAFGFRLATQRHADETESAILRAFLDEQLASFSADRVDKAKEFLAVGESTYPEDMNPCELAAYTTLASVILNLDEVITKS